MTKVGRFNPLKSMAILNAGRIQPRGLVVVIGPNSSGKTQMLKDIEGRMLGQPRKLVVCENIELERPSDFEALINEMCAEGLFGRRVDPQNNNVYIDSLMPHLGRSDQSNWSIPESQMRNFYLSGVNSDPVAEQTDKFLEHCGRAFVSSLFLDRRLVLANTVNSFDYETESPRNELQALYLRPDAKKALAIEAAKVFGKAIWLDSTRGNILCLRVADDAQMPSDKDRNEPAEMRKYPLIENEGDGFKSYMGTCMDLFT
jgi:hypothetical protein